MYPFLFYDRSFYLFTKISADDKIIMRKIMEDDNVSMLLPTIWRDRVNDVSVDVIKTLDIKAILLDVDNTIAAHGSEDPFEGVVEWIGEMKKNHVKIVIVSNNFKRRVSPFAKKMGLPFISFSLKPFGLGFLRAKKLIKEKNKNILVIGDQVFTDVLGANLAGMKSVLLKPRVSDEPSGVKFKRRLEKRVWDKLER